MKCPNCHSSNINSNSSRPWTVIMYILCICFGGTGVAELISGNFSPVTITALVMGALFFYLARNLTVYSYYCNNCRGKWGRTDVG